MRCDPARPILDWSSSGAWPVCAGGGLVTSQQRRAASLLGRGFSQQETGKRVGCNERTLRTWLTKVPGFREAAQREREASGDPSAIGVLHELLHSKSETVRLRAAVALLRNPPEPKDEAEHASIIVYAPKLDVA